MLQGEQNGSNLLWKLTCIDDVKNEFQISDQEVEGCQIIFAEYDTPDYEGYAHVIFIKQGKLYEVNGSHCSCYWFRRAVATRGNSVRGINV
jgi:hypothetical protein